MILMISVMAWSPVSSLGQEHVEVRVHELDSLMRARAEMSSESLEIFIDSLPPEERRLKPVQMLILHNRGNCIWDQFFTEKADSAISFYEQSLSLSRELGLREYELQVTISLVHPLYYINQTDRCLELINGILIHFPGRKWPDDVMDNLAHCYSLKAAIFTKVGDADNYIAAVEEGLTYYSEEENTEVKCELLMQLGFHHSTLGNFEESLGYHQRSTECQIAVGDSIRWAYARNNVAHCHLGLDQPELAIPILQENLLFAFDKEEWDLLAVVYMDLATINEQMGRYENALENGLALDQLTKKQKLKNPDLAHYSNTYLARLAGLAGDLELQTAYLNAHILQQDSLHNADMSAEIARVEAEFQNQIKEQEVKAAQEKLDESEQSQLVLTLTLIGLIIAVAIVIISWIRARKRNILLDGTSRELGKALSRISVLNEDLEAELIEQSSELRDSYVKLNEVRSQTSLLDSTLDSAAYGAFWLNEKGEFVRSNKALRDQFGYTEEEFDKLAAVDVFGNEDIPTFEAYKERLGNKKSMLYAGKMRKANGDTMWLETFTTVAEREDGVMIIGFTLDITSKYEAITQLEQTHDHLNKLVSNLKGIIYTCELDDHWTMRFVSDSVEDITGYTPSELLDNSLTSWKEIIHPADRIVDTSELHPGSEYAYTYRIIDRDDRIKWVYDQGRVNLVDGEIKLEGVIVDISRQIHTEEQYLGVVISTQDAERKRLSSELHDNIGQLLSAARMGLENSENRGDEAFEAASKNILLAMDAVREMSRSFRPKEVEEFGLSTALANFVDRSQWLTKTELNFITNMPDLRINPDLEQNLFRIAQEAVNNTIKYANASNCTVQLMKLEHDYTLTIEDNGTGFDSSALAGIPNTMGMVSMKSRSKAIGGRFELDTSPNRGTVVTVQVPKRKKA